MSRSSFTRFAVLAPEAIRQNAKNSNTRYLSLLDAVLEPPISSSEAFAMARQAMREQLDSVSRPGVMVFAIDPIRGLVGQLWLSSSHELRAGIVGRHGRADLYLPFDPSLPLRHLAVLVRQAEEGFRIRVVDLKTPIGFFNEDQRPISAVAARGPLALRAASYWMFFLPTGVALDWAHPAPWRGLPELVLSRGPIDSQSEVMVQPGERVEGHLVVTTEGGQEALLAVGSEALDRGLLLGRYTRCCGHQVLNVDPISRVHALVVREQGELHLIDCASTNGVFQGKREVRAEPLVPHGTYALSGKTATLRWEPSQ